MRKYVFYSIAVFLLSCQQKFDKEKWNESLDPSFPPPFRKKMINDLTTNYKLVGLNYSQLINLLGEPNYKDSLSLTYELDEDYDMIDPIYEKWI